ncbi:hypothetical protein BJV82DRAFT_490932, partial [Fennellomyces sp. T-0311]
WRKYTMYQKVEFIKCLINTAGKSAAACGQAQEINERTAQDWAKKYAEDPEKRIPQLGNMMKTPVSGTQVLFEEHSSFLVALYDIRPETTLNEARAALYSVFPDITITLSGLQKHLVNKCTLMMKKLEKLPAARISDHIIDLHYEIVKGWKDDQEFCFDDYVFLDEAGFNMHIKRNFDQSVKGQPAKTAVPTQRGVSITILGAMTKEGVISLTLRKPEAVAARKKRKNDDKSTTNVNGQVGTCTEHFLLFLGFVIDVLDRHGLGGK